VVNESYWLFHPHNCHDPLYKMLGLTEGPVWTGVQNHRDSNPGPSSPKRVATPTVLFRPGEKQFV